MLGPRLSIPDVSEASAMTRRDLRGDGRNRAISRAHATFRRGITLPMAGIDGATTVIVR